MTITALPAAPQPSDSQEAFNTRAFSLVASLDQFVTEANALASQANTDSGTATTQAGIASASADLAVASANEAEASAASAAVSAASAAASYDYFHDRYLGSKTADPAVDNDGNALVGGALYWNSATGHLRVWDGSLWGNAAVSGAVSEADLASSDPAKGAAMVGVSPITSTPTYAGVLTGTLFAVLTGIIGRIALLFLSIPVNVKWYGAKGDGVTDDYAAIQAANDYAAANDKGTVYFPAGTYLVKTSVHQSAKVTFEGCGARASLIKWGNADLTGYTKGVVYATNGTDGSPDFLFSTSLLNIGIVGNNVAPVTYATRGVQENCVVDNVLFGDFTSAGLDIMPFAAINHGAHFSNIHSIPTDTATGAYGIRGENVHKCVFDTITTDIANDNYYERGVSIKDALLNDFKSIHNEDAKYGVYIDGGGMNQFSSLEAKNTPGNGVTHFWTNTTRFTIRGIRTISGFINHIVTPSDTVPSGTNEDSVYFESGGSYMKRLTDKEIKRATIQGVRMTRGVDAYAGVSGNGVTYLKVNGYIPNGSSRNVIIDLGASDVGFAGKLRIFSVGSVRFSTECQFAGYADGAGGVPATSISAQVGTSTTDITIATPSALVSPAARFIQLVLSNASGYDHVIEIGAELAVQGTQAASIDFV